MRRLFVLIMIASLGASGGCSKNGGSPPVATRDIAVDGDISDWVGQKSVARDPEGDAVRDISGTDIVEFFVAQDEENLYCRIDFANGSPEVMDLFLDVTFYREHGEEHQASQFIFVDMRYLHCSVNRMVRDEGGSHHEEIAPGTMAIGDGVLELSVPRSALGFTDPMLAQICNNTYGSCIDQLDDPPWIMF